MPHQQPPLTPEQRRAAEEAAGLAAAPQQTQTQQQQQQAAEKTLPGGVFLKGERPVPAEAHEYHARKALNDAAYASLAYKPYSSTMPVDPECAEPKWAWTRKGN